MGRKCLRAQWFQLMAIGLVSAASLAGEPSANAMGRGPRPGPEFDGTRPVVAGNGGDRSEASPPADASLADLFLDPRVSEAQFLRLAGASSVKDLRALLPRLFPSREARWFRESGQLASLDLTPADYAVRHAINYYLPTSRRPDRPAPVLVILHGGGASTATYASSKRVSQRYLEEFIPFAERTGTILVGPASSVGWGYTTRILLRRLREALLADLAVDPDRIYLWGHSMGGMGLVRESHWLVGLAAVSMPNAAGMQDGAEGHPDNFQIDPFFRTYFDLRMVHANGQYDHFEAFLRRSEQVRKRLAELEAQIGRRSGYEYRVEERDHNPSQELSEALIESQALPVARNLYQPTIHALFGRLDARRHRLGPDVDGFVADAYLWLEAPRLREELGRREFEQGALENYVTVDARVDRNVYDLHVSDPRVRTLRILVSERMVNLNWPVTVRVNGRRVFRGWVRPDAERMLEIARRRGDRAAIFENQITVRVR